ncbi:hypothetical protein J1N35_038409 [Gossypium stocksii]|uniref:Uncharacterized protein n=1 Tax=Gossypium stocksii TaxID=47602 RepID=A0A9D3UMF7_9ROSI|nr:hypothetical protein J1N35_038409 [Gossypium stocksii]
MDIKWNVSNGRNILIWDDKWLSDHNDDGRVRSPCLRANGPILVHHIFNNDINDWNYDMIDSWFSEEENKVIFIHKGDWWTQKKEMTEMHILMLNAATLLQP